MLKSLQNIEKQVGRIFDTEWHEGACGRSLREWPLKISLGTLSKSELEASFSQIHQYVTELHSWASSNGLIVETTKRRVSGTMQLIPTHIVVPNIDSAARALGYSQQKRLETGRKRASSLACLFPIEKPLLAKVVRLLDANGSDEADFELVCQASQWFSQNDARGLTARQVPLEGFHAKWLDAKRHRTMIEMLSGKQNLGLIDRPRSVLFLS